MWWRLPGRGPHLVEIMTRREKSVDPRFDLRFDCAAVKLRKAEVEHVLEASRHRAEVTQAALNTTKTSLRQL